MEKEKLKLRTSAKRAFTRLNNNITETIEKKGDADLIAEMFQDLKEAWARVQEQHEQYASLQEEEDEEWLEDVYQKFSETQKKVFRIKKEEEGRKAAVAKKGQKSKIKLKPVDLPKFSGKVRDYPRFKADFLRYVLPHTDEEAAAFTLRMCLSEDAQNKVSLLDEVKDMMDKLDEEYGDPSALTDLVVNEIKRFDMKGNRKLIEFIDVVEKAYFDLKNLNMEKEISNTTIVSIIEMKLPEDVRRKWAERVSMDDSPVDKADKFPHLLKYLIEVRRTMKYLSADLRDPVPVKRGHVHNMTSNYAKVKPREARQGCWLHNSSTHPIEECKVFLNMSMDRKQQVVKEKGVCHNCLKRGHRQVECRSTKKCEVRNCGGHHHKLLHMEKRAAGAASPVMVATDAGDSICLLQIMEVESGGSPRAKLNVLWDGGATISLIRNRRAEEMGLIGTSCQLTVMGVGCVRKEIPSTRYVLPLKDIEGEVVDIVVYGIERISGAIDPVDMSEIKELSAFHVKRPAGEVDVLIGYEYAGYHPTVEDSVGHLLVLENRFGRCIGGAHPKLKDLTRKVCPQGQVLHIRAGEITLQDFFSVESLGVECSPRCGGCRCGRCPPGGKDYTLKEERELKIIEDGLRYDEDEKRWEAKYPWIKDPKQLPDNKVTAEAIMKSTEKRLKRKPKHAEVYQAQIEDMLQRGAARKLTEEELKSYSGPVHYVSHHEVVKPDSKSTPCRIVFNASANYKGHALNNYWAKGPDLLNNLLGILLRFREGSVGVTGDVKKMYHSVDISIPDQHTHRFLWRDLEESRSPDTYVMTAVSFGDKPAGTIATLALRKTAEMGQEEFPEAAKAIIRNTYMDDVIVSVDSREEAVKLTREVEELLRAGGFKMKSWIVTGKSNQEERENSEATAREDVQIRDQGRNQQKSAEIKTEKREVDEDEKMKDEAKTSEADRQASCRDKQDEDRADAKVSRNKSETQVRKDEDEQGKNEKVKFRREDVTTRGRCDEETGKDCDKFLKSSSQDDKVLGVRWDTEEDCFWFKVGLNFSPKSRGVKTGPPLTLFQIPLGVPNMLTKRMVLGQVNSVYDPLGLASPFLVKMKVLLRSLWSEGKHLGWDDALGDDMRGEWLSLFRELYEMERVVFPRSVKPEGAIGNPSLIVFSDGSNDAYGTCAYARWKLDNGNFVCRLIGAKSRVAPLKRQTIVRIELCGAVLASRLAKFLRQEMEVTFDTVMFLVDSEIVRSMLQKESYGFNTFTAVRVGEIQENTDPSTWFWIEGRKNAADCVTRGKRPSELHQHSVWQQGPEFLRSPVSEWPLKQTSLQDLPERNQVVLTLACEREDCLAQRIDITRHSKYVKLLRVTARVLAMYSKRPDLAFRNAVQAPDCATLEDAEVFWIKEAQLSIIDDFKTGKFRRLRPRMREDGIVVVGGRVNWNEVSYNQRELPLLPANHRLSLLYVQHVHNRGHLGVSATASKVRERFWIVNVTRLTKSVRYKCVTCKRLDKRTEEQVMGALPQERLKPAPAWTYTSLDYFGPFWVRGEVNKRSRGKAYGVIFNCLLTRAVHLDLAGDYSTAGFMQVFRRFTSLRGYPSILYSDPGSQLTAASRELRAAFQDIDRETLQTHGVSHGLTWKFSPPDAPWQNGCSEALIKSVKRALQCVIGEQVLMFPELQTVLFETANLLNERPVGRHPKDVEDGTYLCPNDLLLGRASSRAPSGPWSTSCSSSQRHHFIQQLVDDFWKKWTKDYFPSLVVCQKWHTERRNVCAGDIVLLQEPKIARSSWRIGRVTAVFPGRDGKVRTVNVRCGSGEGGGTSRSAGRGAELTRPVQKLVVLLPVEDGSAAG